MRDDLVLEVKSAKTNRSIKHSDSRNETDTVLIEALIVSYVEHGLSDFPLYIEGLVKNFHNRLFLPKPVFFRGVDDSVKNKLPSSQIGPSPCPRDGRYNKPGEKCIYLIDTIDSLYAELNSSKTILVQRYNVPLDTLKIANLSSNNEDIDNSLALAFDMAERGMTSSGYEFERELEKRGKSKYLVSQLLSFLFKQFGWDGIYIPGVHGDQGHHYHNLAIFGTIVDEWEAWANGTYFSKQTSEISS